MIGSETMSDGPYGDAAVKTFTIRLAGSVRLYGPEIQLVATPEFQRLDAIRQLGTAHLVFRSANHTRFEHSLGTVNEVQRIIDAVNRNPRGLRPIDEVGTRLARLLALLHDLAHVPYGHTLEDEFGLLTRHDINAARRERLLEGSEVGRILRSSLESRSIGETNEYQLLLLALSSDDETAHRLGRWAYVVDLVSNTVCADALDYIPRDLTGCGMPVAIGDRFLDYFVVTPSTDAEPQHRHRMALRLDKRGMPRPDVESEVHKLLEHRYELVERVFFHHGKNAASAMLARAVQELELHAHDEHFDWLGDELLRLVLRAPAVARQLGLRVTEDETRRKLASELANAAHRRDLYKLAYLGIPDDDVRRRALKAVQTAGSTPDARRRVEDELAALAGVPPGHVLLHVPAPRMLAKRGNVRVMLDNTDVVFLSDWDSERSGRFEALERAHERLWRVSVYAHPATNDAQLSLLTKAAEDRFALRPRYVKRPSPNPYFGELFDQHAEDREWPAHLRTAAVADAATAAASAEREGRNVSREQPAMIDLLDAAVERLRAREKEIAGQNRLFDEIR